MIFYTRSAQHLADDARRGSPRRGTPRRGHVEIKDFSDGEMYVRILDKVQGKDVWVVASTPAPADNFFELFFLLNALERSGATNIKVIITYLGYARQDHPEEGEAASLKVIAQFLNLFHQKKLYILHPHTNLIEQLVPCNIVIFEKLFLDIIWHYDLVVIPDRGAVEWAMRVVEAANKPYVTIKKKRISDQKVELLQLDGDVGGKSCLIIDDIISTGGTMIQEAAHLKAHGASHVSGMATHGVFSHEARRALAESPLEKVYVTNSILQPEHAEKIHVIDIQSSLEELMKKGA